MERISCIAVLSSALRLATLRTLQEICPPGRLRWVGYDGQQIEIVERLVVREAFVGRTTTY
jgi:hypothetical protein